MSECPNPVSFTLQLFPHMPNEEPLFQVMRPAALNMFAYVLARAVMDEQHTFRLDELSFAIGYTTVTLSSVLSDEVLETKVREILQRLRDDGLIELVDDDVYRVVALKTPSSKIEA